MKVKMNARERRNEETQKRKEHWKPKTQVLVKKSQSVPSFTACSVEEDAELEAADAREFLDYLERDQIVVKDVEDSEKKRQKRVAIQSINLELGMPTVDEAISRMNLSFQEMKVARVKVVRLIHGYGSTGRGGKICVGVREELKKLLRSRRISGFVIGEEFGPCSEESRAMVDRFSEIVKDPDYGRCNHGITIVQL